MDVKTLCLGVLTFGDASGYDIKRYFEDAFSHFFVAGFGSIYPALAELAREGLVSCREEAGPQRPARKVYRISEAGRQAFLEALARTPPRHKVRSEFFVLLYFGHLLTARQLSAVVEERLRDVEHDLTLIEQFERECPDSPDGMRFVAGLGKAVLETTRNYIVEHTPELVARRSAKAPEAARASTDAARPEAGRRAARCDGEEGDTHRTSSTEGTRTS